MHHNKFLEGKLSIAISLTIAACLILLLGVTPEPNTAEGAAAVTVSATINESVTCSNTQSAVAFGTLTAGAISTASPSATSSLSCNSSGGCTLNVQDAGDTASPGLYKAAGTTTAQLIASADATLAAGTEGYGIQAATSSAGTGSTLTLNTKYRVLNNQVGGLTIANTALASSSGPVASREVGVTHKAAISALTRAGSYTDTISYSCTGN